MRYLKEYKDYSLVERITPYDVYNYSSHKMGEFPKDIIDIIEKLDFSPIEISANFSEIDVWNETFDEKNTIDGMVIEVSDTSLGTERKWCIHTFITDDDWYICFVYLYVWKSAWRYEDLDDNECYKCDSKEGLITFIEEVCSSWCL